MQEHSSVYKKQGLPVNPFLCPLLIALFTVSPMPADEPQTKPPSWAVWYISNPAGMAVSPSPSRLAALRQKNCLALAVVAADTLPPVLAEYYKPQLKIDFRTLFENGKPIREQWIFRDEKGSSFVVAVAVVEQNAESSIAFIESYNEDGFIEEERLFDEKETQIKYFYKGQILTRTETRIWEQIEKPLDEVQPIEAQDAEGETAEVQPAREVEFETVETTVYTDYYRYSTSASLRAVERVFQKGSPDTARFLVAFPPIRLRQEIDPSFVKPASTNHSTFLAGGVPASNALYTTDTRGRVLAETYRDEKSGALVEMKNIWVGDRISAVEQKFFEKPQDEDETAEDDLEKRGEVIDEKRIEYEYNSAGDRVLEKDYNNGTLERTVQRNGDREIEEIYLEGKVVLRVFWEGNRKIKEERVK
jgi:hypothetical protein